jgi:peptidoglycan L-alanyl-D-glutamate endopeptidase CwlK
MTAAFKFSQRSLRVLATVDPRMQQLAARALLLSKIDFVVTDGRRTLDEQKRLYGKGRTAGECLKMGVPAAYAQPKERKVTWTITKSNHLGGNAIDVAPYVGGTVNYEAKGAYEEISRAFKQAGKELSIPVEWGGDWTTSKDRPHFELTK